MNKWSGPIIIPRQMLLTEKNKHFKKLTKTTKTLQEYQNNYFLIALFLKQNQTLFS